jgi:hypothetical protein
MRQLLLAACLLAGPSLVFADEKDKKDDKSKQETTLAVAEVSVNRKVLDKGFFANYDQVRVGIVLRHPGRHLLGIDGKASKLSKFADDKGNALWDEKDFFSPISNFPSVSSEGDAMMVGISAFNKSPGKGASKILIKGKLVVRYGSGEKTEKLAKYKFEEKHKATAGDFEVRVMREKADFGGKGAMFEVRTNKAPAIKNVVVKDGEGKAVKLTPAGSTFDGKDRSFMYVLVEPLKEGTIEIVHFAKEETFEVPLDLSVGLDLGR